MAISVPTKEPNELRIGDSWAWRREDLTDFPADSWTLTYYLKNLANSIDIVAAADGLNYAIAVSSAATQAFSPGEYRWLARVTDGADAHVIDSGHFEVLPDPSIAGAADLRTFAQIMLDAIEAALLSRATAEQLEMISTAAGDGRASARNPEFLLPLRDKFRAEVARERAKESGDIISTIQCRYV